MHLITSIKSNDKSIYQIFKTNASIDNFFRGIIFVNFIKCYISRALDSSKLTIITIKIKLEIILVTIVTIII
jgi:hypothetical protein